MDYFAIGTCNAADRREAALQQVTRSAQLTAHQSRRIRHELGSIPADHQVCNGHDVVEAIRTVLIRDHRIAGGKAAVRSVDALLRMAMLDPARREAWSVVARIRRWEERHGRELLKP